MSNKIVPSDVFVNEKEHFKKKIQLSTETKYYFNKIVITEKMILIFLIFSIFISEFMLSYEIYNLKLNIIKRFQYFLFGISIILIILLIFKTIFVYKFNIYKFDFEKKKNNFKTKNIIIFIIEFIIFLSHNSFFFNNIEFEYLYFENHIRFIKFNYILHLISLFKIFIIFRTIMKLSFWGNSKCNRICKIYGNQNDILFIIKCKIKEESFKLLLLILITNLLFFGGMLRILEGSFSSDEDLINYKNIFNCYWNVFITMTTVGYGDIFPTSYLGRLLIIVCSIFGVVIISLIVISVTNFLEFSKLEKNAEFLIEKLIIKNKMEKHASYLVGLSFKFTILRKNRKLNQKSKLNIKNKMKIHKSLFNYYKMQYNILSNDDILEELINYKYLIREKLQWTKNLICSLKK